MKKEIIYGVLAALLFALMWGAGFGGRRKVEERAEYPVVILGDSVLGLCRDETSVAGKLAAKTGQPVFNGAFGGTHMSVLEEGYADNYSAELLNMVFLSKSMAADDFGAQQSTRSRRPVTEYFEDAIDELERIDFSKTKVLILGFGTNDYHAGIPIENEAAPGDVETFAGALRNVLGTLQQNFPDMRVILVTPTYTWYKLTGLSCEEMDTGGGTLERYVEAQIKVADEYNVEVVDLYHDLYPHDTWEDWTIYTEDGLHPNEAGREMIADVLAKKLAEKP